MINHACLMTATTLGTNGFSFYTVTAELGENPKTWQGNLNSDGAVNMADMKIMSQYWDSYPCADPSWCGKADINHDHFVDLADLELFADTWLTAFPGWPTTWFSAWANPRQCHGDADGLKIGFWVTSSDLSWFIAYYLKVQLPVHCGELYYDASVDFDRDCDIDETDYDIVIAWCGKINVPADCATTPY